MGYPENAGTKDALGAPLADDEFILSSLPPSASQKRLALAMVLVLLAGLFVIAGPLSTIHPPRITAFVPVYATAIFVNDTITAILLFAQFSMLRSRALLAISSGYLFTALIVVPWLLTFPDVFAQEGLLGAGLQTTNFLYLFWHGGFPLFVVAYALVKDSDRARRVRRASVRPAILGTIAATAALVCAVTVFVTAGNDFLPPLTLDKVHFSSGLYPAMGLISLLNLLALAAIWVRRRSVLDLCLMVVVCAIVIEVALITFPVPARFTIGWYSGRVLSVLSGSLVLCVLLYEITVLYAQTLRAMLAQRRERDARLMTGDAVSASIAHEIRQPLSAMITNANAGLRWISRATPDVDEAKGALKRIATEGHRVGQMIAGIRAVFRRDAATRTLLDIDELIWEALSLLRVELQTQRVSVRTEASESLPRVKGDHVQIQQVLVNLITNAIESMAAKDGERLLCIKSSRAESGGVTVAVEDSGRGVDPADLDRIFDPLFTTKPSGMGVGLWICRSIIEAHQGQLWAAPNGSQGAVFRFTLPASSDVRSAAS